MKCILLAAGKSNRLHPHTKEIPKTLLKLNDKTILESIIENTKDLVEEYIIISGHGHEHLKKKLEELSRIHGFKYQIIYNEEYSTKNNYYSVYVGLQYLKTNGNVDDVCIINSDVYFNKKIFEDLVEKSKNARKSILIVDDVKELGEEEMKVLVNNHKIIKISKKIDPKKSLGEFIGVSFIRKEDVIQLINALEWVGTIDTNLYYEDAFQKMIDDGYDFDILSTNGLFWNEIDTFEDLEYTRKNMKN